jgi:hypothetical protein
MRRRKVEVQMALEKLKGCEKKYTNHISIKLLWFCSGLG